MVTQLTTVYNGVEQKSMSKCPDFEADEIQQQIPVSQEQDAEDTVRTNSPDMDR